MKEYRDLPHCWIVIVCVTKFIVLITRAILYGKEIICSIFTFTNGARRDSLILSGDKLAVRTIILTATISGRLEIKEGNCRVILLYSGFSYQVMVGIYCV